MNLRPVTREDYHFLYELLKQKKAEQNISHKEMPTWEQHVAFNEKKPYLRDWIVEVDGQPVGRVYIAPTAWVTDLPAEIGIHIADGYHGRGIGKAALQEAMRLWGKPLMANVAPDNVRSKLFFRGQGYRLIQLTYLWEGDQREDHRHN